MLNAFFAYPVSPEEISRAAQKAVEAVTENGGRLNIKAWPQMEVFGRDISREVQDSIFSADVMVCDVTRANLNVYYEIGFAIGNGKAIAPVLNASFTNAIAHVHRDGFFDNIGYEKYESWEQLAEILMNLPTSPLLDLYAKPLNFQQPLFVIDTLKKTDFRNAIIGAIKDAKVFYRSFDPLEIARFSTVAMIGEITSSSGVILPFLNKNIDDAERHNLRAAFLAGLAHGLGRPTLLLQKEVGDPNPTDYREAIRQVRSEAEIGDIVVKFSRDALTATQTISKDVNKSEKSALQRLTLGASSAENEFRSLEGYFVETAEFARTRRGEVELVAGRKGSGKSAIFFMVRDSFRQQRRNLIVDLKPESHQLSIFREELLKIVDVGVFDHTLAAFWYFLIFSELLLALKRDLDNRSKYDGSALSDLVEIDIRLAESGISHSGDFTQRINRLGSHVLQEVRSLNAKGERLTPDRLTNVIFKEGVRDIKDLILRHTSTKTQIVFLFDNIDKGWPANGVDNFDVRLVRLLIEALQKVKRDLGAHSREFMSVVFLRNDIYELLVEVTPDRGKAGRIRIDWTDRGKLRQVICRRLQASTGSRHEDFDAIWSRFFIDKVDGRDSFEYFVDHCLMRPRFLITIIENALANAINRGHSRVDVADCIDAVKQHSNYLVDDFGYEIRDVSGLSAEILYALVGVTEFLTKDEVLQRFEAAGISKADSTPAFNLMVWYGVVGLACDDGKSRYIYDFEYNMKRMDAEVRNLGEDALYVANPAIHVALSPISKTPGQQRLF
jgi:hypothetical protein